MKRNESYEFGRFFVNGTPFAGSPEAWEYIAWKVRKAKDWQEANQICEEYGLTTDKAITAELANEFEIAPIPDLLDEVRTFLGVPQGTSLMLYVHAFLPQQNPDAASWGEEYRQKLRAIRDGDGTAA